jgi:hypothetical protein
VKQTLGPFVARTPDLLVRTQPGKLLQKLYLVWLALHTSRTVWRIECCRSERRCSDVRALPAIALDQELGGQQVHSARDGLLAATPIERMVYAEKM